MPIAYRTPEWIEEETAGRCFFGIGAVCACASGVLALAGNMAHGPADVTTDGLVHLAGNGHFGIYRADHFLLALALAFAVCGYAAIAESMPRHGGAWARFGSLLAQLGAAVIMVALGIDGFAMVAVARAWDRAAAPDQQMFFVAAQALWAAFVGIFALGVFLFFGCAPLLFGVAFRRHDGIPRWLSPAAVLGGAIGMATGAILAFVPITFTTYAALFGTSSSLLALWTARAGFHLWRTARL